MKTIIALTLVCGIGTLSAAAAPGAKRVLFTVVAPDGTSSQRVVAQAHKLTRLLDVTTVPGDVEWAGGSIYDGCRAYADVNSLIRCAAGIYADANQRRVIVGDLTKRGFDGQVAVFIAPTQEGTMSGFVYCTTAAGDVQGSSLSMQPVDQDGRFVPDWQARAPHYLVSFFSSAAVRTGFATPRPRLTLKHEDAAGTYTSTGEAIVDAVP